MAQPLTFSSLTPSLSSSLSQASPTPSLSKSSCPELGKRGQLSWNQRKWPVTKTPLRVCVLEGRQ